MKVENTNILSSQEKANICATVDVNRLFLSLLRGLDVTLQPVGDQEFSIRGIDIIESTWSTSSAAYIVESLDAYVYDYMFNGMIDELTSYNFDIPMSCEAMEDLYSDYLLPLTQRHDPLAVKFCENHIQDIALFDLIINHIDEVDLNTVYYLQSGHYAYEKH